MRSNGFSNAPNATYTNIESAPSMAHAKHYCDITGLGAPYTDPKTRLRYHNKEIFGVIRSLGQGVAEQYLEARGAHTVLMCGIGGKIYYGWHLVYTDGL